MFDWHIHILRSTKWACLHLYLFVVCSLPISSSFALAQNSTLQPTAVYDGGLGGTEIRLRIGNGGAGQSGFIGAWANAFIQYANTQGIAPFQVR